MATTESPFKHLPNELLATALGELSTKDLLQLVAVNHRFYSLIKRIIHKRLLDTASLPENEVILECYHPSAKISTPSLSCRYLGTATCDGSLPDIAEDTCSLADLQRLYSSFRPVVTEENRRKLFRYRWSIQTVQGNIATLVVAAEDMEDEIAQQEIYLDEGVRFSQLCTVTSVVKEGSRRGIFTRHINISDGVIRVFREWLGRMLPSGATSSLPSSSSLPPPPSSAIASTVPIAGSGNFFSDDARVLWVDNTKNVGLRFKVTPGPDVRGTIFEDEPPVFYNLIYEELVIRTSTLLLAVEETALQATSYSGKDIIIAGF